LTITCKYLNTENEITEKFLSLRELPALDAKSYIEQIIKALDDYELLQYLTFLCTDGARVVSSDQNGVYGLLQK
jgi:hypothetical protein